MAFTPVQPESLSTLLRQTIKKYMYAQHLQHVHYVYPYGSYNYLYIYIYIYKIKQKIDFFFLITRKMHHVWTTYTSNKLTGLENY